MSRIRAIETRYNGCRFRSRMEARWAVFFDALDLPWSYEPEGFDVGGHGYYLPDFFVPKLDGGVFCEVKRAGYEPARAEIELWQSFSEMIGRKFLLLNGEPEARPYIGTTFEGSRAKWAYYSFAVGPKLYFRPHQTDMKLDAPYREITCAKSARFEHGEMPEFDRPAAPVKSLTRRIVEALNDGDEIGAEALHQRLIDAETSTWRPEFKA